VEQSYSNYYREGTIGENGRTPKVFVSISTVISDYSKSILLLQLTPSSGRIKFQELTKAYFRGVMMWGD